MPSQYLVLVESPSKTQKIASYLNASAPSGVSYECIATQGHFRHIEGLRAIDTQHETIEFSVLRDKTRSVETLRDKIKQYSWSHILLATDDDREGEAIAWHICDTFGLPVDTTPRIVFHEITPEAIVDAVAAPSTIQQNMVQAQKMRQVLDLVIGYKISPFLWRLSPSPESISLSAGRCQTPALRLVWDNEKQQRGLPSEVGGFRLVGTFFPPQRIPFVWQGELRDESAVQTVLESQGNHTWLGGSAPQRRVCPAPLPLSTSALIQLASSVLQMSSAQVMQSAQTLYQSGLITYHRTESRQYATSFVEQAKKYICKEFGEKFARGLPEEQQEKTTPVTILRLPHEAIRVIHLPPIRIEIEDKKTKQLYDLIRRRTLESCMADAVFQDRTYQIAVYLSAGFYETVVEEPIFGGWMSAGGITKKGGSSSYVSFLESITKNSVVPYESLKASSLPPVSKIHYSESTLVQKLESWGIGRPSTYSGILETLLDRGYVRKENIEGKNYNCIEWLRKPGPDLKPIRTCKDATTDKEIGKLVLQPMGETVIRFLETQFGVLLDYNYTRNMETQLDRIATGVGDLVGSWELVRQCKEQIRILSKQVNASMKNPCHLYDTTEWKVVFTIKGMFLQNTEGKYKTIRNDLWLNWDRLCAGNYSYSELVEIEQEGLGDWEGEQIRLKKGRYGFYLEHGEHTVALKQQQQVLDPRSLTHDEAVALLVGESESPAKKPNPKILETWSPEVSVRRGKFGPYLYYKTAAMGKPLFFPMSQKVRDSLSGKTGDEKMTYFHGLVNTK